MSERTANGPKLASGQVWLTDAARYWVVGVKAGGFVSVRRWNRDSHTWTEPYLLHEREFEKDGIERVQ